MINCVATSTGASRSHPNPIVEDLARKRNHYEHTFEEHKAILQKDPIQFQSAWDVCVQDAAIAKPGQRFIPSDDDKEEFMARCEAVCSMNPKSFEE
jgi:hypothetical protein